MQGAACRRAQKVRNRFKICRYRVRKAGAIDASPARAVAQLGK
jgi:hypothetical protein